MDIEYTVKIKGKKVPSFKKGWKKGEIAKVVITFKGATGKDTGSPLFIRQIFETGEDILRKYVIVNHKILKK